MATLAEIKENPGKFLKGGGPWQWEQFLDAVEELTLQGLTEDEAISLLLNDGPWWLAVDAVTENWLPTHVITTSHSRRYVMRADNAFFTAAEWAFGGNADYELDDDGTLLFQGRPALDATIRPL